MVMNSSPLLRTVIGLVIRIGSYRRLLVSDAGLCDLLAELRRGSIERGNFVVGFDQKIGNAETVQRRHQMLDRPHRARAR